MKEANDAELGDGRADTMSVITPTAFPEAANVRLKRPQAESEDSTSRDSGDESEQDSRALSASEDYSNVESPTSIHGTRASKRQKKQRLQDDDLKVTNMQSKSTNSDRQAMIDAELALSANRRVKIATVPTF